MEELEIRPEYLEKLKKIQEGKHSKLFHSIKELEEYFERKE